jgi:DNA-binding NarL/FixJ family response regulator
MPNVINVFAVDDDDSYLDSLEALFRPYGGKYKLIGCFSALGDNDGIDDMLDKIQSDQPDVVLMDYSFKLAGRPEDFGLELVRRILKKLPDARIIMLVGDEDDSDEVRLLKLKRSFGFGACAYLTKSEIKNIFEAIDETIHGDRYVDPETLKTFIDSIADAKLYKLGYREIEVIKHLSEDKIVKEIAEAMFSEHGDPLTQNGVFFHIKNIKVKMDVKTLHGIVGKAAKINII